MLPPEQLAALERLGEDELRPMVLQLLEENHQLRNRLQRQEAANAELLREARSKHEDSAKLSRLYTETLSQEAQCKDMEPEDFVVLQKYRRAPALPTPRRPKASSQPPAPPPPAPPSAPPQPVPKVQALGSRRAGAEPAILRKEPSLHVNVLISHGAVLRGSQWVDAVRLRLPPGSGPAEVWRLLVEQGIRWEPARPHGWDVAEELEDCRLNDGGSRLLFKGMPLKQGIALTDQGVFEGSELRLLRTKGYPERLRSRSGHEQGAARGLLMNPGAPPWAPVSARKGPEEFFDDSAQPSDRPYLAHISALAYAKVGKTNPVYLDA